MANWDYDRLRAELKLRLGQQTGWTTPTDWYGRWINNGYRTLTCANRFWGLRRNFDWPELETRDSGQSTVAGTAYITTPTDALVIRRLWNSTDDAVLDPISWPEYIKATGRATTASRGQPTQYVRSGAYLYLLPTPDAVYTVYTYYRKVPTALSSGTDTTAISEEWDEIVVRMAACQAFLQLGMPERLKMEKAELNDLIGGVIGIYNQEGREANRNMGVDPAYRAGNQYPS